MGYDQVRNSRRKLMAAMLSPLLFGGCKFSRYFDVEWDEEVELFGGKIIIVHIKRGYERTSSILDPDLRSIQRSVEITFDAGGRIGIFKRKFDNYDVCYINKSGNNWYILLGGIGFVRKRIVSQAIPILIIYQDGQEVPASSWMEVPYFSRENIMPPTPNAAGVLHFNGKLLTIAAKEAHWKKYPRGAGDGDLINVRGVQPPAIPQP
nr:hypothetical protein [uncultured Ottowia sp.]